MSRMLPDTSSRLALGAITFRDRPFETILAAAARAGWDGIGLTVGQCLSALERGIPLASIPSMVADAGLRIAELELIRLCEPGPTVHANALVEDLVALLQPDRVHVAAWHGSDHQLTDEFAAVCQRMPHTTVAFEFMAYNRVPRLEAALNLAESTGQPNASIVLDVLHFFRTHSRLSELTVETMQRVGVVQLSDVVERPLGGELDEARHRRTYPGRGTLPSVEFLRAIAASGPLPPLSVEPINDTYEALPLTFIAEEALIASVRLLAEAGVQINKRQETE